MRCNEIARLFRLTQGFRRIFCRFEKLDAMYMGFIQLALVYVSIVLAVLNMRTP